MAYLPTVENSLIFEKDCIVVLKYLLCFPIKLYIISQCRVTHVPRVVGLSICLPRTVGSTICPAGSQHMNECLSEQSSKNRMCFLQLFCSLVSRQSSTAETGAAPSDESREEGYGAADQLHQLTVRMQHDNERAHCDYKAWAFGGICYIAKLTNTPFCG